MQIFHEKFEQINDIGQLSSEHNCTVLSSMVHIISIWVNTPARDGTSNQHCSTELFAARGKLLMLVVLLLEELRG